VLAPQFLFLILWRRTRFRPRGTQLDPQLDGIDLLRIEPLSRVRRRHAQVIIWIRDALYQFAFVWLAGNHRRAAVAASQSRLAKIEP
jgi:hypothetical protein